MVKIAIYGIGKIEEKYLDICEDKYPEIRFVRVRRKADAENAKEAEGCHAVVISTACPPTRELLEIWKDCGVEYVATRSIGIEHMDVPMIESFGMRAAHTTYSPSSVADFAIMLMLMVTRNMKIIQKKYEAHDFREGDFAGKELWNMTVGILGTGSIGETVVRHLSGFGCRILANSRHEKESLKGLAEYVDTDTLLRESDLVSIHMAATPETEHFLDDRRLSLMKKGAYLVNTARGSLVDTKALIAHLESGHLAGAALDVIENEKGIYYSDKSSSVISHRDLAVLDYMPNVIVIQHMAYYTQEASLDTMENVVRGCLLDVRGEENPWRI